jgi:hypothetical protein
VRLTNQLIRFEKRILCNLAFAGPVILSILDFGGPL